MFRKADLENGDNIVMIASRIILAPLLLQVNVAVIVYIFNSSQETRKSFLLLKFTS